MKKKLLEKILESIYPDSIYCLMCGSIIDDTRKYSLCDNCIEKFIWVTGKTCEKCGKILEESEDRSLCFNCRNVEHYFDKGFTCARYGLYERNLILEFKKRDKSYIGRILGEILYDRIVIEDLPIDVIISVPIHKKKLRVRGYNQAELMAEFLGKKIGTNVVKNVLVRSTDTIPMKKLGVAERRENLKGAFAVKKGKTQMIQGKNILLVDDIYTTGATLDECSKVLRQAGANKVYVLTFAAGSR